MVKKNYVAPATNESRTKLRTGLLAGSNGSVVMDEAGNGSMTTNGKGGGSTAGTDPNGDIEDARRRGRASLD